MPFYKNLLIKPNSHILFCIVFLVFITGVKIGFSFLIPLNILPGALFDDTLFYRLGQSLAQGKWLGEYDSKTLIKGFTYPLFIGISIYSHIPLRVLEALLVCASSLYFVLLFKNIFSKKLVLLFYSVLIFYPLQYGVVEFRILRDAIYPQILLLIFTALLYLLISSRTEKPIPRSNYFHVFIACFSLFFFFNTREEGIWIGPVLLCILLAMLICFYKYKNIISLCKLGAFGVCLFVSAQFTLIKIQQSYYQTSITNLWKDKNFQEGFGSLQRLSGDNKPFDYITYQNWEALFKVSPTAATLKQYIYSPIYQNWMYVSCEVLRSQGHDVVKNSGCPSEVVSGFVLFALNNVLWTAGKRTPSEVSNFMKKIGDEIDGSCDRKEILCNSKPFSVLPAQLSIDRLNINELFRQFRTGFKLALNFENPDFQTYSIDVDLKNTMFMRSALRARLFDVGINEFKVFPPNGDEEPKGTLHRIDGFVDKVIYRNRQIFISGWFKPDGNSDINSVQIFINGRKACLAPPVKDLERRENSNSAFKFECTVPFEFLDDSPIKVSAYVLNSTNSFKYSLKNTTIVDTVLSNKFNAQCYLENNLDVKYYVDVGVINPENHYKYNGIHEERVCSPLYSKKIAQYQHANDIENFSVVRKKWFTSIFKFNSDIYSNFIKLSPAIVLIYFLILIRKRSVQFGVISALLVFAGLFLSRLSLISLMGFLALAPISPLYLASGLYCLFIFVTLCFIGILATFDKRLL